MLLNSFITLPLFFSIHLSLFVVLFFTYVYCTLLDKDNPSHSRSIHLLQKSNNNDDIQENKMQVHLSTHRFKGSIRKQNVEAGLS